MKALVLEEYNKFSYKDMPDPQIEDNEVLVEVKACCICGSDVHGMDGSTGRRIPPIIMGHEASGIIIKTGREVKGWNIGDRVTFDSTIYRLDDWYTEKGHYNLSDNRRVLGVSTEDYRRHGAFAEYVAIPGHILYKLPEKVTLEQAAMVEPVAVAKHAVNLSGIKPDESVVVVGAGMIGIFVVQLLKICGATPVIAIDINPLKLEQAEKFGADHILNPKRDQLIDRIKELTENRGADVAIEAVGLSETVNTAIDSLRRGGKLIMVGNITQTIEFPLQKVVTEEISMSGSCAINGEYQEVLGLIEKGKLKVDDLISAVAPLSEGAEWFDRLYKKEPGLNKVILKP